jgi:large subunit ribosomal protein L6
MSRVGLKPIVLPNGVSVEVGQGLLTVKGPKGSLQTSLPLGIECRVEDETVRFTRRDDSGRMRAFHGLARALAANAVVGVTSGFEKRLEIQGVGYRAVKQGSAVQFSLGYSHPIDFVPPPGVTIDLDDPTKIVVRGTDKQAVGQVAAEIRALRPPDAYKGKGVRHAGERIRLKAGKTGAK